MTKHCALLAMGACAVFLCGCYTVLRGPRLALPSVSEAPRPQGDEASAPTPAPADDVWGSPYGGGEASSRYGYGYGGYPYSPYAGYPVYGSYGYSPYSYYGYDGYGPYSYGYDPYYQSTASWYNVPVGYELVTDDELDALRASREALSELQNETREADALLRSQEVQQRQEAWARRGEPRVRQAPAPEPRPTTTSSPPATYSSPGASGSGDSSTESAAAPAAKPTATPKKTRR